MFHVNSLISLEKFQTLCQLQNGIQTAMLDAKANLTYRIDDGLAQLDAFEDEVAGMTFKDDGPNSRAAMIAMLEADRFALGALRKTIDVLDQVQCALLLEKVEKVYARAAQSTAADLYRISQEVYGEGHPKR
jgi:hypothetical protein